VSLTTSGNKVIALCWKQRMECGIRSNWALSFKKSINVWKINWHVTAHANPKYMERRTYCVDNQKVLTITRAT
jgi:hypothetical protein